MIPASDLQVFALTSIVLKVHTIVSIYVLRDRVVAFSNIRVFAEFQVLAHIANKSPEVGETLPLAKHK